MFDTLRRVEDLANWVGAPVSFFEELEELDLDHVVIRCVLAAFYNSHLGWIALK